jgi:nucleotide-binding universal stress UspA family protein
MYKKVLVPLDGSAFSEFSLDHVKTIAGGCGVSEVILFRVIVPIPEFVAFGNEMYETAGQRAEAEAKKYLDWLAGKLRDEGIPTTVRIVKGDAAHEILEYSSKSNIDLIIMTTHGNSGIVRWFLGSVADKVLRHSTSAVLLVTPHGTRSGA